MNIQVILGNVIDRCGGDLIKEKIPSGAAVLHVLNVIETMGLELADTFKGTYRLSLQQLWSAKTGTLPASPTLLNKPQYVRYRLPNLAPEIYGWQEIFIVNDIEELTHAENVGRRCVMFSGQHPFKWDLSFVPHENMNVEVFGQFFDPEIASLSNRAPYLPAEFSQLVAVEAALRLLDDLLLLDGAQRYQAFIVARKNTLMEDRRRLDTLWQSFLYRDENKNINFNREPFDIFKDNNPEVLNLEWQ